MNCVFARVMECRRPGGMLGMCERCEIPNKFGYFFYPDKPGAEQRFILETERNERIAAIDANIRELEERRALIMALPSRDAYMKGKP